MSNLVLLSGERAKWEQANQEKLVNLAMAESEQIQSRVLRAPYPPKDDRWEQTAK